jgi:hypothetical protein
MFDRCAIRVTYPVTPSPYTRLMSQDDARSAPKVIKDEWVSFPGGELEGQRPRLLCPACRGGVHGWAASRAATGVVPAVRGGSRASGREPARTLCFQCYRANLDRNRALRAAGDVPVSEERFQSQLPFERVDILRLERLKAERSQARVLEARGMGRFVGSRREAQIAARRALQTVGPMSSRRQQSFLRPHDRGQVSTAAIHAVELQFPESWLRFVRRGGGACSARGY